MRQEDKLLQAGFDPTFLFTWKGIRTRNAQKCHSHEYLELCYVQSGRGSYRIDDKLYEVQEGDLIILNAGADHQALVLDEKEARMEFFVALTDLHLDGMPPNCLPFPADSPVVHTSGDLRLKISKLCVSMEAEKAQNRCGRYYMMKAYAIQLLLLLLREREQEQTPKASAAGQYTFETVNRKEIVEKIIDYFEDHYADKISLDQIAGNMYLSPFYISRIFKAETGNTPIHYLIEIRMEKAMEFLRKEAGLSIQEAAARVGYDDAYHFSKLFKKKFGISPSAARGG